MKQTSRYSKLLLCLTATIVCVAMVLVCGSMRKALLLPKLHRGFFSAHAVSRYAARSFSPDMFWQAAAQTASNRFAVVRTQLEIGADTRGVYFAPNMEQPPLREGRFFTQSEMTNGRPVVLVGAHRLEHTQQRDGTRWLTLAGTEFEVIGVLGTQTPTPLDSMQWIPLQTAFLIYDTTGVYQIDTGTPRALQQVVPVLDKILKPLQSAGQSNDLSGVAWLQDKQKALKTPDNSTKMYLAMATVFLIVTVYAAWYWSLQQQYFITVGYVLGFSKRTTFLFLLGRYCRLLGIAFLAAACTVALLVQCTALELPLIADGFTAVCVCLFPGIAAIAVQISLVLRKQACL